MAQFCSAVCKLEPRSRGFCCRVNICAAVLLNFAVLIFAAGCGQVASERTAEPTPTGESAQGPSDTSDALDLAGAEAAGAEAGGAEMASPEEARSASTLVRRPGATTDRKGFSKERIYFVTNREVTLEGEASSDPDIYFGATAGEIAYGVCEVSIPYRRAPGTLPEPSVLSFEFRQDPAKHVVLMQIECFDEVEFWSGLSQDVSSREEKQLLVYIHGFSASFRDAARRTAQVAYDMNYQGPALFFSWPAGSSEEGLNRWNYTNDLRRADESRDTLVKILSQLSASTGAQRIHVVAHSMGNHLLTESLRIMSDQAGGSSRVRPIFDGVAMAAPDVNARHFREVTLGRIQGFSRRFTIYASRYDKALKFSESLNGWKPLGSINEYSAEIDSMEAWDVIDASDVSSNWFSTGHAYYGDMPEVIHDLQRTFAGIPVARRGLLAANPAWRLIRQVH